MVHSLISSRLDICNAILINLPEYQVNGLQRLQNSAARLVTRVKRSSHISPPYKHYTGFLFETASSLRFSLSSFTPWITWIHQPLTSCVQTSQTASLLKQLAPERSTLLALLAWSLFFTCRAISLEQRPTSTQKSRYLFPIQSTSQNIFISENIAFKPLVVLCMSRVFLRQECHHWQTWRTRNVQHYYYYLLTVGNCPPKQWPSNRKATDSSVSSKITHQQ